MLKNYLKTALRSFKNSKVFTVINITGLAAAIGTFIILSLYVQNDLSFDKFNKNYKRIYRVNQEFKRNGEKSSWSLTPSGFAGALKNEFPGLQSARIFSSMSYKPVIKYDENLFTASDFIFCDQSVFNIFSFQLIQGDVNTALTEPFSIVLSQSEAKKLFGSTDPLGKVIHVSNLFDYKVTGIAADAPQNSSIQFKYIAPFNNVKDIFRREWHWDMTDDDILNNYFAANYYTFIMLQNENDLPAVNRQLPSFVNKYCGSKFSQIAELQLQRLEDIHFSSVYKFDFPNKANIKNDYILGAISVFILLIACVNFINLLTAQSVKRGKEIGLRKVLGASRGRLILQFIMEELTLTSAAVVLAVILILVFRSDIYSLTGQTLSINSASGLPFITTIAVTWFLAAIVTCLYPAIYLSSMQPSTVIKNAANRVRSFFNLKKVLIVSQFSFSIFMIIATLIIYSQYSFIKSYHSGFDKEQVVYLPVNPQIAKNYEVFKQQLTQNPGIKNISMANWVPGKPQNIENYSWAGKTGRESDGFYSLLVENNYVRTMGFNFLTGRDYYSEKSAADINEGYIINETAALKMGWSANEAIGKTLSSRRGEKQVIGVLKDFTVSSLYQKIEPVVLSIGKPDEFYVIAVKMEPSGIGETLNKVMTQWKTYSPDSPFDYHFLDSDFSNIYQSEEKLNRIVSFFSGLSILISCLGLLGLISHSAIARKKEIGIRKVNGAGAANIIILLTKEYTILIAIANIIAWPAAYYFMNKWLQDFAYRTEIGLWVFALAGVIAMLIAVFTVGYHALKAASANPVESLRYE